MALEIVQIIASGTFGHVAVVRDSGDGRLLAAKVLKQEHLENERVVARMLDEASLLGRLRHPNIVRVEELREIGGRPVILLEWVRGIPLDSLVAGVPTGIPIADACEIARTVAHALYDAWHTVDPESGRPLHVIHRDIKPSNLLLSGEGEMKVLDFGIARGNFAGRLSHTVSVVLGAQGFTSPERLDGADDNPAGDVYAVGCVLFELLTTQRIRLSLHPKAHAERLEKGIMHIRPPGVSVRTVSELARLVQQMCAYDPADRPDHGEVVTRLGAIAAEAKFASDLPWLARRHVIPALESRTLESPTRHPAWKELRFLEERSGLTPPGAPLRQSDSRLEEFLAGPGWHLRLDQLHRMLALDPSWTARPLLAALGRLENASLWSRWMGPQGEERQQLLAVLDLLRARPTPEVQERARPYLRHRDPEIVMIARQIAVEPS